MINNLGTKLFKSVTDKAGDLGDKFETEFAWLSRNVTVDMNLLTQEALSLSSYVKVAIVMLCIVMVLIMIRLSAFGLRVFMFKARAWIREIRPPPQVILMMPTEDGSFRKSSTVYTDQQTRQLLDKLKLDTIDESAESSNKNKRLLRHNED